MHEIQVNIVEHQIFQRRVNALVDPLVPRIVQLGGDPDLASGDTRVFDAQADFMFIAICERTTIRQPSSLSLPQPHSRVDMAIASL